MDYGLRLIHIHSSQAITRKSFFKFSKQMIPRGFSNEILIIILTLNNNNSNFNLYKSGLIDYECVKKYWRIT